MSDDDYAMPTVGDVIAGKYRLERVAGEGGMGIVYAAEHLVLKQRVAVKVLNPDAASTESTVERFQREAQAAARIQSEHVARVFDAGSLESGAPFLVMEFLEGCDLGELIQLQKTLSQVEVADMMLQALEALAHAHVAGIVHRDLKPANLFLACRPDGGNTIKVVDFGISKSKASYEEKTLTGHHVLGSPAYMSPEQLRNSKDIDGRADIWSLGVVAYEMLTGTLPFDGDGVGEIFAAILEHDAKPVHEVNPNISPKFSAIVGRCLKRDVNERWIDAAELARAVAPFGSGDRSKIVASVERLFTRARNHLDYETPSEARLVVDLIAAAAERAKSGSRSMAPPPSQADPPPVTQSARKTSRPTRWAIAVVGLAVVIGGVSMFAAARITNAANAARPVVAPAPPPPVAPVPSASASTDVENEPAAVELPDNGDNAQPAQRPRSRPQKPTRPKFLNSRE